MFRPQRATLRSAGFTVLLAVVFVMVNSQVVYAAGSNGETGDLLAPLNIRSSEGVPINGYELNAEGGSILAFRTQALAFALSGLFTLIRLLVGLAGWAIEVAFRFPLLKILTGPAQEVADAYEDVVVDALGLKGLLLAWAFVFAGFMLVRGRVGRGLGEMFLTLLIAAFAASAFVRPDYLLAADGPLGQSQQVGAEVAQRSVNAYDWGGKIASKSPCDGMAGRQETKCMEQEGQGPVPAAEVARPLQDSVTNALIVKPYMLLQYGRILDPAREADREAYVVHLKWVAGGYQVGEGADTGAHGLTRCDSLPAQAQDTCERQNRENREEDNDHCDLIWGPAKQQCERYNNQDRRSAEERGEDISSMGPAAELLDSAISDEDREFAAFLADLKEAGDVGEAAAAYAEKPTWWRVGGAVLLLIGALFICGMLLSSAIVLLGTQGVCAAAAAAGGVAFVAGMLPGPARQSVWKWLSLWGIAVLAVVGICAFIPFFGIAVDATITDGPDLMVERILLIDVLAIAGAAGHRRLLTGIASFGRRMAMRMRYAKVGGTHLPGDTSELGATLAMHSPAALGGYSASGGLRALTRGGGGGGRFGMLGTRQRLMRALGSLTDGAGMPVDTGRILSDATAEAGRGLAPLTTAAALGGAGTRVGAKGVYGLLIGRRPDREQLAKWRKPTAGGDPDNSGPDGATPGGPVPPGGRPGGPGGGGGAPRPGGVGPLRPGGPPDRYRNEDGEVVDRKTGQVLHDQNSDRTLLSTRAHNRLVRFRGYRLLNRGGRTAYAATVGLPASTRRAGAGTSQYANDARQQVRVWGNTLREDGRAWTATGRHIGRVLQEHTDDRGGPAPFTGRRLPVTSSTRSAAPTERPSAPPSPGPSTASRGLSAPGRPGRVRSEGRAEERPAAAAPPAPPARRTGSAPMPRSEQAGPVLPGIGSARSQAREEARRRMQELMRRTAPDAERLRQEQARPDDQSNEGGEQM